MASFALGDGAISETTLQTKDLSFEFIGSETKLETFELSFEFSFWTPTQTWDIVYLFVLRLRQEVEDDSVSDTKLETLFQSLEISI